MWNKLTYPKKTKLVLIGAGLMLLLCWQWAFKPTWDLKTRATELEAGTKGSEELSVKVATLEQRLDRVNQLMEGGKAGEDPRQHLLNELSQYCSKYKVLLKEMPGTRVDEHAGYRIETQEFTVEGSFLPILKLHYQLEKGFGSGRIASSAYRVRRDPRTKKDLLSATIYIHFLSPIAS